MGMSRRRATPLLRVPGWVVADRERYSKRIFRRLRVRSDSIPLHVHADLDGQLPLQRLSALGRRGVLADRSRTARAFPDYAGRAQLLRNDSRQRSHGAASVLRGLRLTTIRLHLGAPEFRRD